MINTNDVEHYICVMKKHSEIDKVICVSSISIGAALIIFGTGCYVIFYH